MRISTFARWCPFLLLSVLTLVAYFPPLALGFVNWDDQEYLTENVMVQRGLTAESIAWAFSTFEASNYHPVTWLSLMLDVELFGLNPVGFHAVNVLLHLGNVLLTFLVFRRLSGSELTAGIVAGVLAIHPQHVESVAWVAERKDLLSTFFGLWAMLHYVSFTGLRSWRRMLIITGLHGLSLLSKPTLVTLPCLLLLLDYWPLKRWQPQETYNADRGGFGHMPIWRVWAGLCWDKWSLFLSSLILCIIVMLAQRSAGSLDNLSAYPTPLRVGNAIVSYVAYIRNEVWPLNLCAFYPHPEHDLNFSSVSVGIVLVTAISLAAIKLRHRSPCVLIGWLWYLGTLVPMLGLVQVGRQAMADRYMYFPMLGLSFAWAGCLTIYSWRHPSIWKIAVIPAALATLVWIPLTWRQISYWSSGERLWGRVLEVTYENPSSHLNPTKARNPVAHNNLAYCLVAQERFNEALSHIDQALAEDPNLSAAWNNRGALMMQTGFHTKALLDFSHALELKPRSEKYWNNHASALGELGRFEEAKSSLDRAIELSPKFARAHWNRFLVWVNLRNLDKALSDLESYSRLVGSVTPARQEEARLLLQQAATPANAAP